MPLKKQKILIVEDEIFNIRVLLDILKPKYRIVLAKDGHGALERAGAEPHPDLILLDVLIPGPDGCEVCARLKSRSALRDIPIIFMTSKRDPEDVVKGFKLGAVDYIVKPINYMELLNRVKVHLKLRKTIMDLECALEKIDRLQGLIPICACCKKIRNDKGFWENVENFLAEKTSMRFEFSFCPDCSESDPDAFFPKSGAIFDDRPVESGKKESILIVEDERFNINLLTETLKDNYELTAVDNGKAALEAARRPEKPDLILLDVLMPEMDGWQVCQALMDDPATREIPVVFMTVKRETDDILKAFYHGAVDYLIKPINYVELNARVKTHLTLKRRVEELKSALLEIRRLSGLLPICPSCKKVRDDRGYWRRVEDFIAGRTVRTEFSHGICPECASRFYPDLLKD